MAVKYSWGKVKVKSNRKNTQICYSCGKWRKPSTFLNDGDKIICERCYVPKDE